MLSAFARSSRILPQVYGIHWGCNHSRRQPVVSFLCTAASSSAESLSKDCTLQLFRCWALHSDVWRGVLRLSLLLFPEVDSDFLQCQLRECGRGVATAAPVSLVLLMTGGRVFDLPRIAHSLAANCAVSQCPSARQTAFKQSSHSVARSKESAVHCRWCGRLGRCPESSLVPPIRPLYASKVHSKQYLVLLKLLNISSMTSTTARARMSRQEASMEVLVESSVG